MQCKKLDYETNALSATVSISVGPRNGVERNICSFKFDVDPSGVAALIRSVDVATNDNKVPSAIGLRPKKRKKVR